MADDGDDKRVPPGEFKPIGVSGILAERVRVKQGRLLHQIMTEADGRICGDCTHMRGVRDAYCNAPGNEKLSIYRDDAVACARWVAR